MFLKKKGKFLGHPYFIYYCGSNSQSIHYFRFASVTPETDWDKLAADQGWLNSEVRNTIFLLNKQYT